MAEINYTIPVENTAELIGKANAWIWRLETELDELRVRVCRQYAAKIVEVLRVIHPQMEETEDEFVSGLCKYGLSLEAKAVFIRINKTICIQISRESGFVSASLDGFGEITLEQVPMAMVVAPEVFRKAKVLMSCINQVKKELGEEA